MVFYLLLLMELYMVRSNEAHLISHLLGKKNKWGMLPEFETEKTFQLLCEFYSTVLQKSFLLILSPYVHPNLLLLHLYYQFSSLVDILAYCKS